MANRLLKSKIPNGSDSRSLTRRRDSAKQKCKCDESYVVYMLGAIGYSELPSSAPTNEFQRYDFVQDTWTLLVNSTKGYRRMGFAVATRGQEIWVLGGHMDDYEERVLTDVHMYTETSGWSIKSRIKYPRQEFCAAFVNGRLYAIGGRNGRHPAGMTNVEVYARGRWRRSPKMRYRRYDFATCVVGNRIIVAGGVGDRNGESYVRGIEIFSTLGSSWTVARYMTFCRKSFALVHVNSRMYAVGGDAGRTVICNNSIADENWSDPVVTMPPLSSYDAFTLNGEIYVVGKHADRDETGSFQKLRMADHEWDDLQCPWFPSRGGVRIAIISNRPCENAENPTRLGPTC